MNECLKGMKVNHVNIGYHIRAIEFMAYKDLDFLVITGAAKYEIRYVSVASGDEKLEQLNKQNKSIQILAVPYLDTFYPYVNIHKVYQINMNTSLILSKDNMFIVNQIA